MKIHSQNGIINSLSLYCSAIYILEIKIPATGHLKESFLPVCNRCHDNMTFSCISVNKHALDERKKKNEAQSD